MIESRSQRFLNDLVLPTTLFAALGGMNWAVRGTRGFGGMAGCIFAGVLWGVAWWYIARDAAREQSRRYASGWVVVALTFGIAIAGARGWRQWSHFFTNQLFTNFKEQEFVPISKWYGFLWLFIAGVPWAGLGACFLAWCGSRREMRVCQWVLRIGCGLGASALARYLFDRYPQFFLPIYSSIEDKYKNLEANPDLQRVVNDCGAAIVHLGYYLGFLLYEVVRRDWKNVVLISTVGIVNGVGWAALQNWEWAPFVWKDADFAWWRCWESTGGISIGIAYGLAYFFVNGRMSDRERAEIAARRVLAGPNFEWLIVFGGLTAVLSLFVGPLLGWNGSVGFERLDLPPKASQFLTDHLNSWGNIYFALVILSAAAYYLLERGAAANNGAKKNVIGLFANIEFGTVVFVTLLVAPLFIPKELVAAARGLLTRIGMENAAQATTVKRLFLIRLVCIGLAVAFGVAWYFVRRKTFDAERTALTPNDGDPNFERLGVRLAVLAGLAVSILCGMTGWFQTYRGESNRISQTVWHILGPFYLLFLLFILAGFLLKPRPRDFPGDPHPRAHGLLWFVLIVQNVIAQFVTGPPHLWNEFSFNLYYVLLFIITALVLLHLRQLKSHKIT